MDDTGPELVASFFTLTGAGFAEPPRHSFLERCRAAADAGFSGVGLHVDDLARTVAAGLDPAGMRAVLDDLGLRLTEIEFLGGWAFDVDETALERTMAGIEAIADALGGRHVSAGEFRSRSGRLDVDAAGARLGALTRRLDERGLRVALEAFPWSALPDVATAEQVLHHAATPTAGLMIDVWHFFNGGALPELLDGVPSGGIAAVQLNDGHRVHDDFLRHARAARRLPGDGELDVVGLVQAVRRTGFTGPWGVEVNTPELRALPVAEAAKRAAAAATEVLDMARGQPWTS